MWKRNKSSKREKGIGWAHTTNTRRTWLHYQIIIIMIYGGRIRSFLRKGWKPFFYYHHLLLDGKQWWAFYISFHTTCFFSHCIMACRQMHARYNPEPLECLYVLSFYNLFFRLLLYQLQIWLELARLGLFFFFLFVFFCFAFFFIHEIDYGVVCLYGAWSMEHYGILRGE